MNKAKSAFTLELIAPCGTNCGICSAYLAYTRNIPRRKGKINHFIGCRPRKKLCAFIKGRCQKLKNNEVRFCFECGDFLCYSLGRIDERYRCNYRLSMIDNLKEIKQSGIEDFLKNQREKYKCSKRGGVISVNNKKCYDCEPIERWRA